MTGFGLGNLPYGVDDDGHVVVAYEEEVIDLALAVGLDVGRDVWASGSLNAFFALGREAWITTRKQLQATVSEQPARARRSRELVRLRLPWEVADYADFYASLEHATNMGRILRPTGEPLPSAWRYLPIGYHGRSGSIVVGGSPVPRPAGLTRSDGGAHFGPSRRLDVEVELGFVVGAGVPRGQSVSVAHADQHIFGVVLLNDWSARDIQAFEYQPLGPFLGKSFATSVSPWVVPLESLDPWRVPGPVQEPPPALYLQAAEPRGVDVHLELSVNGTVLSTTTSAGLYWSYAQQLAHWTVNGSGLRPGDLFASGTISGSTPGSEGSLMELYRADRWLEDGDTVTIRGWCGDRDGDDWISLGDVSGTVVPCGEEVESRCPITGVSATFPGRGTPGIAAQMGSEWPKS